jgi:hypothetical protein
MKIDPEPIIAYD